MVPSLLTICILALRPYAEQLQHIPWSPLPFTRTVPDIDIDIDLHAWIVLIHLFRDIPPHLSSFSTTQSPQYTHGFLTVLSLPHSSLPSSLLADTPNLTALDASSTALSTLPPSLVHLRLLYLRNCTQITDRILPVLCALPLLSVVDLSGTKCTPVDPCFPLPPSSLSALFQPSIQASLSALASLYPHAFPSPLYTLTYLPPPPPPPVPRKATQDSFVVFSSNSTKIGNTNTLGYEEDHPARPIKPVRPLPAFRRPAFYDSRPPPPLPTASPFHLHRPPPPLSSLNTPSTNPNPKLKPRSPSSTPASLNLQNHKALLARKGIDAFIKLRSTPSTPSPEPSSTSIPPSTSRNPFKKPTASLKPISSFPPPLLPPSLAPPRKKPKITPEPPKSITTHTSFNWKTWGA